jgi:hypothetical protein
MPFRSAGTRTSPHVGWEKLCHDASQLVLGKLSLRELACSAPTCREFREAYQSRLTEERGRRRSVAEETFGKERLASFATAFQGLISGTSHEGLRSEGENILVINESGQTNLLNKQEAREMPIGDGRIIHIRNISDVLQQASVLWGKLPGSGKIARITIYVVKRSSGIRFLVTVSRGAGAAAAGLMLSICTRSPADMPATWQSPCNETVIWLEGPWGVAGRKRARDLVGPLRPLAESFEIRADSSPLRPQRSSEGGVSGQVQPLGRLVIRRDLYGTAAWFQDMCEPDCNIDM